MVNDDADIWAAFASTPARQEPVANRDNSLAGFQRRLLGECGEALEKARQIMREGEQIVREQAATIDELRTRYDVLTDRTVEADRLLGRAFQLLYSAQYSQLVPYGIGELLEEMGAYWDA